MTCMEGGVVVRSLGGWIACIRQKGYNFIVSRHLSQLFRREFVLVLRKRWVA